MSGQETISSYKRYKDDTTFFLTWLSNAAKACGWKTTKKGYEQPQEATTKIAGAPNVESTRLKGKERKEAKSTASVNGVQPVPTIPASSIRRYSLTTKDLLDQINILAQSSSSSVSIPQKVRNALQSAIDARQRFCDWFGRMKPETQQSTDRHQYFLDVLRSALDVLPRGLEFEKPKNKVAPTTAMQSEKDFVFMSNAFEALEVEDVDEDELVSAADVVRPATATTNHETYLYQLEMDRRAEVAFILFSFFEDLHRLRNELKKLWIRFRDGEIDLPHATCLTAAALELVRRSEEEAFEAYLTAYEPTEDTYSQFLDVVYVAQALNFGQPAEGPELDTFSIALYKIDTKTGAISSDRKPTYHEPRKLNPSALEISQFDEFVYLPAGRTISKLVQYRTVLENSSWPVPIMSMRANYIVRPELLDDPRIQAFERQDRFICQLVLDMNLDDQLRNNKILEGKLEKVQLTHYMLHWIDPLSAALRPIWADGHITTRMVWAAQVAFDIHEICSGNPMMGPCALESSSRKIQDSFQFFTHQGGQLDTRNVRWKSLDAQKVLDIHGLVTMHMVAPSLPLLKTRSLELHDEGPAVNDCPPETMVKLQELMRATGRRAPDPKHKETAKRIGVKSIEANEDPFFLMKANLLYSGTMLLDVASRVEEAGVALANHHLSIFVMAHLYNALIQLSLLNDAPHWPEMERIIELHTRPIFANDIPKTPKYMVSRFAYRTGLSATTNPRLFNIKQSWKFETTAATQSLRNFFASRENLPRVLSSLAAQAELHELRPYNKLVIGKASTSSSSPSAGNKQAKRQQIQVTPRQTLIRLGRYIDAVLPDMQIDYVALTRRCSGFLKRLRVQIAREARVKYPVLRDGDMDSNDHGFLFLVFGILRELDRVTASNKVKPARDASEGNEWVLEKAPEARIARRLLQAELTGQV